MSNLIELASIVVGPLDDGQDFDIYQGYVMNESYIFFLDEGSLWLRHVHKVAHVEHLYINGDSGGIILAEHTQGNIKELIESIMNRLCGMDALTFLTEVLLWTPERVDMNLRLDRFQKN
ncbi:hypothetical protein SAMN05428987_4999 [Paenibacillus sp. CF095]|uniref:hypothetical protein n=1 Tax=Paenibacillus sp. CF095 TaxID=1881033 RepID=UPI0008923F89|nr:hypothetical protein [Paenibacillus sp. CF095]SDD49933.1 hypothetical protein SAMN05428987_4999 [Paenibacillus sp. CF095]